MVIEITVIRYCFKFRASILGFEGWPADPLRWPPPGAFPKPPALRGVDLRPFSVEEGGPTFRASPYHSRLRAEPRSRLRAPPLEPAAPGDHHLSHHREEAGPGMPQSGGMVRGAEPLPADTCPIHGGARQGERTAPDSPEGPTGPLRLTRPTAGLQLAMDPRIPDELEVFSFMLPETLRPIRTEWLVDGRVAGRTGKGEQRFLWPLSRGEHRALARVWLPGSRESVETRPVTFRLK